MDERPVPARSGHSRGRQLRRLRHGGWRSERPYRDDDKCTQCLLCWVWCPDTSVVVADEKVVDFDMQHCKGCGICAHECPADAIEMVPEGCELPGVK